MISNQAGALAVDSLQRLQGALSSTYHCYTFLTAATCPSTLTAALSDHLPHIDPSSWEQRLAWGGTYVNGQRVLCDMHLPVPARIEYYEPKPEAVFMWSQANSLPREHIIAEDEDLLAVFKPAGLSSLPTREQVRFNLRTLLEDYLRASSPHPSLHMPSRIDTSVCGLVLASKSAKMHKALQRLFEERRMRKIYRLEASSPVSWQELRVNKLIGKDFSHPILRKVYDSHDPRARTKEAHTIFRMLRHCGALDGVARTLIEAQPLTGRTHQIRVHAASAGIAITGDNFYGGAIAPELRLISFSLEFCHPLTGSALSLAVPDALTPVWAKT